MNKSELVSAISVAAGLTKIDAGKAVEAFTSSVIEAVSNGDTVALVGFGTFKHSVREGREGRNPSSGKTINIPTKKIPKFLAGKQFKDSVNI